MDEALLISIKIHVFNYNDITLQKHLLLDSQGNKDRCNATTSLLNTPRAFIMRRVFEEISRVLCDEKSTKGRVSSFEDRDIQMTEG
jgi:hypothetical protein